MNINVNEIIALLGPGRGELLWNLLLYAIFFLALIALFIMPDRNLRATLLVTAVLVAAVIVKLSLSVGPRQAPIIGRCDFGMLVLNALMFSFPLLSIGLIRTRKRTAVFVPLILGGIMGGLFFFGYWIVVQNARCPVWA
jgi:hypothetical protein